MCHYGRTEIATYERETADEKDDEGDAAELSDDDEREAVAPPADD